MVKLNRVQKRCRVKQKPSERIKEIIFQIQSETQESLLVKYWTRNEYLAAILQFLDEKFGDEDENH